MVLMVPLLIMATSLVSKINTRVALVKGWVNSSLAFMGQLYIGFYRSRLHPCRSGWSNVSSSIFPGRDTYALGKTRTPAAGTAGISLPSSCAEWVGQHRSQQALLLP